MQWEIILLSFLLIAKLVTFVWNKVEFKLHDLQDLWTCKNFLNFSHDSVKINLTKYIYVQLNYYILLLEYFKLLLVLTSERSLDIFFPPLPIIDPAT